VRAVFRVCGGQRTSHPAWILELGHYPEKIWFAFPLNSHKPSTRVQRILSFLLLLFLPLAALADGMVVPTVAYPAKITIPDQRALICYSNGTERLVIETRFTGAGTNFAWVVPLPGQPVIEEATTGLFPTLQYLFRPKIVHAVPQYYIGILFALGFVYLLRLAAKSVSNAFTIAVVLLLLVILAALLLPALSAAKTAGMSSVSSEQPVSILDRKLVGIFETTTITSHDAKALQTWLSQNGFAVPTNAEPVIASYVKDGWVFVATKVRRDQPDNETSTPHPLSFTFKTDKPVYPMRLTGVDNRLLSVELYVFGLDRAEASHFKVERCTHPNYPQPPHLYDNWFDDWRHSSSEIPDIVHPLLRKWVVGSPVATKLTATLSRAAMRNDVWINWTPFCETRNRFFSWQGALTTALNWGTGLSAAGLLTVCLLAFFNEVHKTKFPRRVRIVMVTSIILTGLFYLFLPKTEVRVVGYYHDDIKEHHLALEYVYANRGGRTIAETRTDLGKLISTSSTNAMWHENLVNFDNYLVGGQIREEDSPGNYTIRETNGQLEFVSYDAQAAEHIQTLVPW
jgi:hypothetical protein